MATPVNQIEGQWEELVRQSQRFVGRRVRVTVLADDRAPAPSILAEFRHWLAERNTLETASPIPAQVDAFGEGLADKFRRQGLVL